jgi:class 3 adenylate cyclase
MDNQPAASAPRTIIATVLFFDVVGYTKQAVDKQTEIKQQFTDQLASCLGGIGVEERIILDTGDGAAIGFLQHPEDALRVALCFSQQTREKHPDMRVRTGIHLGPINVVRDMNGINNMVGDGINDAQRIMSFAGTEEIYVSRPYYDFVSRLNAEYESMFVYRGAKKDKHGRAHQVYEISQGKDDGRTESGASTTESSGITLEPFNLDIPEPTPISITPVEIATPEPATQEENHFLSDLNAFLADAPEPEPAAAKPGAPAAQPESTDEAPTPLVQKSVPTPREPAPAAPTKSAKRKAEVIKPGASPKAVAPSKGKGGLFWTSIVAGVFLLAVGALFALPYVMPWSSYAARLEQNLSASLGMPVKIGAMHGRLLPSPQLEFDNISGGAGAFNITQVRAHLGFHNLFAAIKPIKLLEIQGLQLNGAQLQNLALHLNAVAANDSFLLESVEMKAAALRLPGSTIPDINGTLNFTPQGQFTQARLQGQGGAYQLDIDAANNQPLQLVLNVRGASLPPFTEVQFDGLELHANVSRDSLLVRKLDSRILGGVLLGNARVSWQSGWHAEGLLLAKTLTLGHLKTAIDGDLEGEAQFVATAPEFKDIPGNLLMRGSFQIGKGLLHGVDMIAAARQRTSEIAPEAKTEFDAMTGEIELNSGLLSLRGVRFGSPRLEANGAVEIQNQQLGGTVAVNFSKLTGLRSARFQLEGSVSQPLLR